MLTPHVHLNRHRGGVQSNGILNVDRNQFVRKFLENALPATATEHDRLLHLRLDACAQGAACDRLPSRTSSMSGMFDSSFHFARCLRISIKDQGYRSSTGILMTSGFYY